MLQQIDVFIRCELHWLITVYLISIGMELTKWKKNQNADIYDEFVVNSTKDIKLQFDFFYSAGTTFTSHLNWLLKKT